MHRYAFAHSPFVDDAKCIKGAPLALERLQVSVAFEVDALHEVLEELRLSLSVSLPCSPKYLRRLIFISQALLTSEPEPS
jgi:hypothetical protein